MFTICFKPRRWKSTAYITYSPSLICVFFILRFISFIISSRFFSLFYKARAYLILSCYLFLLLFFLTKSYQKKQLKKKKTWNQNKKLAKTCFLLSRQHKKPSIIKYQTKTYSYTHWEYQHHHSSLKVVECFSFWISFLCYAILNFLQ